MAKKMNGPQSIGLNSQEEHCWLDLQAGGSAQVFCDRLNLFNLVYLGALVQDLILCPDCGNWYKPEGDDRVCPYCGPEPLENMTGKHFIPADSPSFESVVVHFGKYGCGIGPGARLRSGGFRQIRQGVVMTEDQVAQLARLLYGVAQCADCGGWFRVSPGAPIVCPVCNASYEEDGDEHE